ncbi:hypothetical protein CK203_105371 [Vitis vinifera]|uniref:Uncharacterized protein n=1 Tax=Vitis vinifera TaxID=29760 RepID=A0A438FET3_VITVI|nr:hypothetical protein CK203_105371 [Vitis vinifera]
MGRGPWLVVVIACKTCYTLVNDPDNLIRIARVGYPDVLWSGCIYGIRPDAFRIGEAHHAYPKGNPDDAGPDDNTCHMSLEVRGKAIDKLDAKEFRERFCIPNNVAIELLNGRVLVPSEKAEEKTIIFSKEQFNAGLRFPLPALFKEFLHSPRFHPSSFIPTSSGC